MLDLGVLFDWFPHANFNDWNAKVSPTDPTHVNTFWYMMMSIASMIAYRIVSGISFGKRFGKLVGMYAWCIFYLFFIFFLF